MQRLFIPIAALVLLSTTTALTLDNTNLHLKQDFAGHFFKAKQQPLNHYLQGWNLQFWGGYSEDTYPNGYHYLLRLLLEFFPDATAAQIITIVIFAGQILALIYATNNWLSTLKHRFLALTLSFLVLTMLDSHFLGGVAGTIYTGGGPAALGLVLFIFILGLLPQKSPSLTKTALLATLLGLTFLVHTISALVSFIVMAWHTAITPKIKVRHFEAIIIGLVIGLPTIWLNLNPYFTGSRINFPGQITFSLIPIALTLVAIFQPQTRKHPLLFPSLLLITLSFTPKAISDWLWRHGVTGIHWYRFFPYGIIPLIIIIVKLINPKKLHPLSLWIPLATTIALAVYLPQTHNRHVDINLDISALPLTSNRIMDVSVEPQKLGVPHALNYLLTTPPRIGTENLFFESSRIGILYHSLENLISPDGYTGGIDLRLLRQDIGLPRYQLNASAAAQLLGVNYYVVSSSEKIATPSARTTYLGTITNHQPQFSLYTNLYLLPASSQPLAVALDYLPKINSQSFLTWWPQATIHNLFQMPSPTEASFATWIANHPLDFGQPPTENITITQNQITYSITPTAKDTWVPVLVKFTYHPDFIATSNNQPVPIARISPDFMLVPSQGNVTISWHTSPALDLIEKFSLSTLLLGTTMAAIGIIRNSRHIH